MTLRETKTRELVEELRRRVGGKAPIEIFEADALGPGEIYVDGEGRRFADLDPKPEDSKTFAERARRDFRYLIDPLRSFLVDLSGTVDDLKAQKELASGIHRGPSGEYFAVAKGLKVQGGPDLLEAAKKALSVMRANGTCGSSNERALEAAIKAEEARRAGK